MVRLPRGRKAWEPAQNLTKAIEVLDNYRRKVQEEGGTLMEGDNARASPNKEKSLNTITSASYAQVVKKGLEVVPKDCGKISQISGPKKFGKGPPFGSLLLRLDAAINAISIQLNGPPGIKPELGHQPRPISTRLNPTKRLVKNP